MAASAHEGVVDADCAVHGVPNLYVASAAVFPTSSHANPTLTIVALALRLADHLKACAARDAAPAAQAEPFRLFANRQTALLAAIYDSIAHAAHDWLVRWLAGRVPAGLGHPLSRLPRVQEKVGQIAGLLLVNRSLLEQAAALRFSAIEANLAKVTITDNAIQAVNIALELTGNHGLSRQNPLERHYRNVLCGRVHTPQSDSAWLAAGNFVFQSQG